MEDKFCIQNMNLYYGDFHALKDVSMNIPANEITAFIGPSGCGKSTFLKSLNRMNDLVEGCRIFGSLQLDGEDIYGDIDVNHLRKRVGMVFQNPNPFPMSVYDNIAYGPRTHGIHSKAKLDEIVERSLKQAAIWDELKDRLKKSALGLSGGQQQRLCIARALAIEPEVILMDEPTSALDPISTSKIEDLVLELKDKYTIVIWMEGDDPECVDRIIGGSVELSMNIDSDYDDQSSLLWKFVTDIKDTLFDDKPIDAAGNEAPNDSYYSDRVITWENRRNKD